MPTLLQNDDEVSLSDDDRTVDIVDDADMDPRTSCTPTKPVKETNAAAEELPKEDAGPVGTENETKASTESSDTAKQVTPPTSTKATTSKKKQQKKVNQLTLGNFFFGVKKSPAKPKSPAPSKSTAKSPSTATKETPNKAQSSAKPKSPNAATAAAKSPSTKESPNKAQGFFDKTSPEKPKSPNAAAKSPSNATMESPNKEQDLYGSSADPIELTSSSSEDTDATPKTGTMNTDNAETEKTTVDSTSEATKLADDEQPAEPEADAEEKHSSDDENNKSREEPSREEKEEDAAVTKEPKQEEAAAKTAPKRKRKSSSKAAAAAPAPPKPPVELSPERQEALQKYKDMKSRFETKADELFQEVFSGLPEEEFDMPEPKTQAVDADGDDFPDFVVANMTLLIEGSTLPISKLTEKVSKMLSECHSKEWDHDAISSKIKLLSQRKSYIEQITKGKSAVDVFEDDSNTRIWRWEILTVDIFPSEVLADVKKARSARKKVASHWTATSRLIQAISSVEAAIGNPEKHPNYDKEMAKVSQCEEKVLKFEREAEKKKMAEQAKRLKEQELEAKKLEKELEKERKKQEAEQKKQEQEAKKNEAAKARDEAKRKREAEKVEKAEAKKAEEEKKVKTLNKQKSCFMSFFAGPPKKKSRTSSDASEGDDAKVKTAPNSPAKDDDASPEGFNVKEFRSMINGGYQSSKRQTVPMTQSRKRRTGKIGLTVYITVQPEEGFGFDAQPFAEQQRVQVSNRYRFLSFHEDCRPAYYGTWTKKSNIVTGRTPFGKDGKYLDYDYDSEAEWEEGDDEIGEDIEDEDKCKDDEDDEGDARIYDYDDGFCVADDRYLDSEDDVDDETKALHKKKLQNGEAALGSTVLIVAPALGGLPAVDVSKSKVVVEGCDKEEGMKQLSIHKGIELCSPNVCLDAFPPLLVDETQVESATPTNGDSNAQKDEYTDDEMRLMASFIHHCELNSKEKIIEDLRTKHPNVFTNRAKAMRKLDSIAVKQRFNHSTGVYWEVNRPVLEQLGLKDILAKKVVDEPPQKPEPTPKSKSTTASKETKSSSKKRASSGEATNPKTPKQKKTTKEDDKSPKKPSPQKSVVQDDAATKASARMLSAFLIKKKPKSS